MNNPTSTSAGPTDFIQKLYRMINDSQSSSFTYWSNEGDTFIIHDPHDFAKLLLPRHFKHNNFQSFIRQLNKYGFSKVKRNNDDKRWEFRHESFNRNGYDSLKEIKRKAASTKRVSVTALDYPKVNQSCNAPTHLNSHPRDHPNNDHFLKVCMEKLDRLEKFYQGPDIKFQRMMEGLAGELSNLHKTIQAHDEIMQTIVQCIISQEKALIQSIDPQVRHGFMNSQPGILSSNIQNLVANYRQASKVSEQVLDNFSKTISEFQLQTSRLSQPVFVDTSETGSNSTSLPEEIMKDVCIPVESNLDLGVSSKDLNPDNLVLDSTFNGNSRSLSLKPCPSVKGVVDYSKLKAHVSRKRPRTESLSWTWIVPPNVLLVDDDPTCQKIYARSLQILGCSYEIAADGVEAVRKMQTRKYDMVLMDIWMPEMDGLSATKRIREFDLTTPIIAITGNYQQVDREFYLQQGINEVLGKPLKVNELGSTMQKHWLKFCISREADLPPPPVEAFPTIPPPCSQNLLASYLQPSSATI